MTQQNQSPVVTRDDAIGFLEGACRNWSSVPKLSEDDIGDVATELLRFVKKRIEAALSSGRVRVKPLEWGKTSYGTPEVYTVVGVYRINSSMAGGWSVVAGRRVLSTPDGRVNFPTVEDAKAATQADYERRILSTIEPSQAPKEAKVGIIAHIDHGKTSLTAAITRVLADQPAPAPNELEVVAWRCFDVIMRSYNLTDDADHAGLRGRSDQWVVEPLVRLTSAQTQIAALTTKAEELTRERDAIKQQAQSHACEARTANSTIYEIYQAISGAKGEPGNWNGAQPVIEYIENAESRLAQLEEALRKIADGAPMDDPNLDPLTSHGNSDDVFLDGEKQRHYEDAVIARAALQEEEGGNG